MMYSLITYPHMNSLSLHSSLTEQSKIGQDTMSDLRTQLLTSQNHVKQQQHEINTLQQHTEELRRSHMQQLTDRDSRLMKEQQALTLVRSQCRDQQTTLREMEERHVNDELQLSALRTKGLATDQELIEKRNEISALRAALADKEVTNNQHTPQFNASFQYISSTILLNTLFSIHLFQSPLSTPPLRPSFRPN